MRKSGGFTLVEVMITVAIVAILSAIALPAYTSYITRGRLTEAHSTLMTMRVEAERFFQDNRTFAAFPCAAVAPATDFFTYSCPVGTATTYQFVATGNAGTATAGFTFNIFQNDSRTSTALPAGWGTAPVTCWVRRKGGIC